MTLKIIIGTTTNDVKFMLGGEDVSRKLQVSELTIGPLGPNQITKATLVVYAEAEVRLLPEGVTVYTNDARNPQQEVI